MLATQQMFHKIGFVVGAAVGLSYVVFALNSILSFQSAIFAVLQLSFSTIYLHGYFGLLKVPCVEDVLNRLTPSFEMKIRLYC